MTTETQHKTVNLGCLVSVDLKERMTTYRLEKFIDGEEVTQAEFIRRAIDEKLKREGY